MNRRAIEQRWDRLDRLVQAIAEGQVSLRKLIAKLAKETRSDFDRVAKQFNRRSQRTRTTGAGTGARMRQTDERIDKLVVAIGELVRQRNAPRL